jgi:hypothetical protein
MYKYLIITIIYLSFSAISGAQDTLTKKELKKLERNFLIPGRPWSFEIPLWIPGFGGEFAYGDAKIEGEDGVSIENPLEPDPTSSGIGGIFSRLFTTNWYLKFFYLTKIAYEQNRIKVQFDMVTGSVGNSVEFNYNNRELVKASFLTLNLRLYAGYKFVDLSGSNNNFRYEAFAYGGVRTYIQQLHSELNGTNLELDITPVWFEPLIGLENQFTWKHWMVNVHGDYGSRFSQNRNSVQLSAFAYYRIGRLTSIKFGWNHVYMNQNSKILGQDYTAKLTLSGPSVALALHF